MTTRISGSRVLPEDKRQNIFSIRSRPRLLKKAPYADYYESRSGLFGFLKGGPSAEEKELVIGIGIGNSAKAYKLQELRSVSQIKDKVGATEITLRFDNETDMLNAKDLPGKTLDHLLLYWFG